MRAVIASRAVSALPEFAGNTWAFLQYVIGLQRLGVETYWVDHQPALDPRRPARNGRPKPHEDCHGIDVVATRFAELARRFGFEDRYCIVYDGGKKTYGKTATELVELIDAADVLFNLAGPLPAASPLMRIPRRAYVDLDPGFTQVWAHQLDLGFDRYDFFFTVGQNVGRSPFTIPIAGVPWTPFLPPVVLEHWPACIDADCDRMSTVADWRGSQLTEFDGVLLDGKRDEFVRFLALPDTSPRPVEPALCIGQHDWEDLGLLLRHGWHVRDPYLYAGDVDSYREFIQSSRAELSVAKSGYIATRSGWVSDRSACYLASGKPVVVQSTEAEWRLPTDLGFVTFRTPDEAASALGRVEAAYLEHCEAARQLAETQFDSDIVLGTMLDQIDLPQRQAAARSILT